jgi:hypothetical protein
LLLKATEQRTSHKRTAAAMNNAALVKYCSHLSPPDAELPDITGEMRPLSSV